MIVDASKAGFADILQEFGLKYHMVNVFNAYRESAGSADIVGYSGFVAHFDEIVEVLSEGCVDGGGFRDRVRKQFMRNLALVPLVQVHFQHVDGEYGNVVHRQSKVLMNRGQDFTTGSIRGG